MKIANILSLTPKAVSGLCQSIAKQKIPGLKTKTNSLIEALASDEGRTPEAFLSDLNKLHESAYWIPEQRAIFDYDGQVFKLANVHFKVCVHGWSSSDMQAFMAMGGIYDEDGYTSDLRLFNALSGYPQNDFNNYQAMLNYQLGLGKAISVINDLNARKKHLTPEILKNEGWSVEIGVGSKLLKESQFNKASHMAVKARLITCSNCQAVENDKDECVFTEPHQVTPYGIAEFRVCQDCGRRTWLDEWDDPNAAEAPFEYDEVNAVMKKRMDETRITRKFSDSNDKITHKGK